MELRQLRHFVAVAEERHFGRAAARLGIEQSPLSRSIHHLEGHLKTSLLERTVRGSRLTPAGAALLPEARAILAQVARLQVSVSVAQATTSRLLRIGVCDAVATIRLSMCLSALRQLQPDLSVVVMPLQQTEAINAIAAGAIDVCIALDPVTPKEITRVECWTERFVVAVPGEWRLRPRTQIPVAKLLATKEVLVAEAWAQPAERWLHELAVGTTSGVPPVRRLSSCIGFLTSIGMDFGVGLVPSGFEDGLDWAAVRTRPVEGRNHRLPVVLLYSENNQHPGITALRTVVDARPWRGNATTSVGGPAGTPDRSP